VGPDHCEQFASVVDRDGIIDARWKVSRNTCTPDLPSGRDVPDRQRAAPPVTRKKLSRIANARVPLLAAVDPSQQPFGGDVGERHYGREMRRQIALVSKVGGDASPVWRQPRQQS